MWPLAVAIELGGCFFKDLAVSPGKWWTQLRRSANIRVARTGENRAAWAKATISAGVADCTALFAVSVGSSLYSKEAYWVGSAMLANELLLLGMCSSHNLLVAAERWPLMMMVPL